MKIKNRIFLRDFFKPKNGKDRNRIFKPRGCDLKATTTKVLRGEKTRRLQRPQTFIKRAASTSPKSPEFRRWPALHENTMAPRATPPTRLTRRPAVRPLLADCLYRRRPLPVTLVAAAIEKTIERERLTSVVVDGLQPRHRRSPRPREGGWSETGECCRREPERMVEKKEKSVRDG